MAESLPVSTLFSSTAGGVIGVQAWLDTQAGGSDRGYSIPRVDSQFRFGLVATKEKKILFIPRGKTTNQLQHEVNFSLVACPNPPLPLSPDLPAAADALPLELIQPDFIVEEADEQEQMERLLTALENGQWRAAMSDPSRLKQKAIVKEVARIRKVLDSPDESNPQLGMISLKITDTPASWLVVHLTDDSDNDGVFLLPSGATPVVDVFSVPDDGNDRIGYLPLHLMVTAVRRWMSGTGNRTIRMPSGLPRRWGISSLEQFARDLFDGYLDCQRMLALQTATSPQPSFYDLTDVTARLSVSVSYDRKEPQFGISDRQQDEQFIDSRVGISIERSGAAVRVRFELIGPGFVLTPAARDQFVAEAADSADEIARPFSGANTPAYVQAIRRPPDPQGIVVFLSAAKPGNKFSFLVVWPGVLDGSRRDFVFTCNRDSGKVGGFSAVVGMEEDPAAATLDSPQSGDGGLSEQQYQPFSNFLRAVRLWRTAISG